MKNEEHKENQAVENSTMKPKIGRPVGAGIKIVATFDDGRTETFTTQLSFEKQYHCGTPFGMQRSRGYLANRLFFDYGIVSVQVGENILTHKKR